MTEILQICSYFIGSRLYSEMFAELDRRGFTQEVFIPIHTEKLRGANAVPDTERMKLYYRKNFHFLDRFLYYRKIKNIEKDLFAFAGNQKEGIAHAHSWFINGGVAKLWKERTGMPYVVEVQNTDVNTFFRYMPHLRKQGIRILEEASAIVFYSPSYLEQVMTQLIPKHVEEELRKKSIVIGSGVNNFWFENKGAPKKELHTPLRLIFVGNIDRNKNVHTLLQTLDVLKGRGVDAELKVIGKIFDTKTGEQLQERGDVTYIPFTSKEELIEHYRSSAIFVMASKYDTFGLVYVEAMTQGLPIIYSKGQGFDGQAEEGHIGYHVEYNNPEEIADRIEDVVKSYETISANAFAFSDQFSWKSIGEKYEALYRRLEAR